MPGAHCCLTGCTNSRYVRKKKGGKNEENEDNCDENDHDENEINNDENKPKPSFFAITTRKGGLLREMEK